MKIAIISDIHGNYKVLKKFFDNINVDKIYNLGDNVAYNGKSKKVFDLLQEKNVISVVGGHDLEALVENKNDLQIFNDKGELLDYGIDENCKSYIRSLPYSITKNIENNKITFIHSLPVKYNKHIVFQYVNDENVEQLIFKISSNIIFVGHSHKPQLYKFKNNKLIISVEINTIYETIINKNEIYVVDVGSLGASRHPLIIESYVTLDTNKNTIKFYNRCRK